MSQPTNGARPEPDWVATVLGEIERLEARERIPVIAVELAGVSRQRVNMYVDRHPEFRVRVLRAIAVSMLKKADRLEDRLSA